MCGLLRHPLLIWLWENIWGGSYVSAPPLRKGKKNPAVSLHILTTIYCSSSLTSSQAWPCPPYPRCLPTPPCKPHCVYMYMYIPNVLIQQKCPPPPPPPFLVCRCGYTLPAWSTAVFPLGGDVDMALTSVTRHPVASVCSVNTAPVQAGDSGWPSTMAQWSTIDNGLYLYHGKKYAVEGGGWFLLQGVLA